MPCRRLTGPDAIMAASAALASARARSAVRVTKLSSWLSRLAIRRRQAWVSSTGDSLRAAISRDASAMPRKASSVMSYFSPGQENGWHEHMRRLVAMRPCRGNTADHLANMAIGLDQLGHILGRQDEACLAGELDDFIVGGRIGHVLAPALLLSQQGRCQIA